MDHEQVIAGNPTPLSTQSIVSRYLGSSPHAGAIARLMLLKVPERTGMSIMELLDLDSVTFKAVEVASITAMEEEGGVINDLSTELDNTLNQL